MHFIDSWEGETAFLKLDGRHAWLDSADSSAGPAGLNLAGGDWPESRRRVTSYELRVTGGPGAGAARLRGAAQR